MELQSMVPVVVSGIPQYLQGSALHRSLALDADDEISVPVHCFKPDETVICESDVVHLLHTMRYWGACHVPVSIVRFYLQDHTAISIEVVEEFGAQFPYIAILNQIQQERKRVFAVMPMIDMAIEQNEQELVIAMHHACVPWSDHSASAVARVGNLEMLKFAHISGCPWNGRNVACSAVDSGHLDCLKYAIEQGASIVEHTLDCACTSNLACTKYVCEHVGASKLSSWLTRSKCEAAASAGSVEILQYLRSIGCPWSEGTTNKAVKFGHLACLKYACENGCPLAVNAVIKEAANWGYVDIVHYLREHGCRWDEWACFAAATCKSPECLKYLHENGCPWDAKYIMNVAARCGRAANMQYLQEQGCTWTLETACEATTSAHYEACLQFLWECGCLMDESIVERALERANHNCVQYLIDIGCPYDAERSYKPNHKGLAIRNRKCLRQCWN